MPNQELEQLERFFSVFFKDLFPEKNVFWLWEFPSETLFLKIPPQGLQQFSGRSRIWQDKIHPEDRDKFIIHLDNLISDKTAETDSFLSHRIQVSENGYQQVLTKFQVIGRDEKDYATRIIATSFDLETIRYWKQIHKDANRFPHVMEAIKAGLWEWNTELNEVYFSPSYMTMLGYDPDKFPQNLSSWTERVHPSDINEVMNYQYSYINFPIFGDTFEGTYRFLAADNTYKWITSEAKIVKRNKYGRAVHVVGVHTIADKLHETNLALMDKAHFDHLTGLSNRWAFDAKLATLTKEDYPVSLIYIDVDGLKKVNDNLGHEAGDQLLTTMTQLVRRAFRANDMIARIGGDEFVVLLLKCSADIAKKLMQGVRSICQEHNSNPENFPVFLSMGIASTEYGTDLFRLQFEADREMIQQKRNEAKKHYKKIKQWLAINAEKQIK